MKYVRYEVNGSVSYGILSGDTISELSGDIFGECEASGATVGLSDVKLLAPTVPSKILAVGLNYRSHLGGEPEPKNPEMFIKTPSCINNPNGERIRRIKTPCASGW